MQNRQPTILIVDSNAHERHELAVPLLQCGYVVQEVSSVEAACKLAQRLRPELIYWNGRVWLRQEAEQSASGTTDATPAGKHLTLQHFETPGSSPLLLDDDLPHLERALSVYRHDMNNPLFAISGSAESLAKRLTRLAESGVTEAAELLPRLQRVLEAAERIQGMIQTFRPEELLARIEAQKEATAAERLAA